MPKNSVKNAKATKTKAKKNSRLKTSRSKKSNVIFSNFHLNQIITTQSRLVQAKFDLDDFMNLVVKQMLKLTPATGAVIELAEGNEMVYRAATGSVKNYLGLRLPIVGSISGLCIQTEKILRSTDTELDKRVNREACRKVGARSLVVAPLFYQGKPVGVLKIMSRYANSFTETDVQTLKLMANLIASGIAHKLFYEEIKRQTNKLKDAEERFRLLVESSRDYAIFMLDPNGFIKTWNLGAKRMLGFTENEIVGQQFNIIYSPEAFHENLPQKHLQRAQKKGRFEEEGLRIKKNGSDFWVNSIITTLYDANKKFVGFAVILRDLTESKKLEASQNEFISIVNHELRTPLTSIRGSLSLLLSGTLGDFSEKAKTLIEVASKNSERLGRLINDILDVQKLNAGKMQFNIQALNLKDMINEAIAANQMYAKQLDVSIVADIEASDVIVNIDADRFLQIMANLISNAIKYTPAHDNVIVKLSTNGACARVSIIDHGPGIPEEFQSRIFQKFAQANATSSRQFPGTGLGLNITKTLIEKFGGKIDFTSSKNGTTFFFDLPLIRKAF